MMNGDSASTSRRSSLAVIINDDQNGPTTVNVTSGSSLSIPGVVHSPSPVPSNPPPKSPTDDEREEEAEEEEGEDDEDEDEEEDEEEEDEDEDDDEDEEGTEGNAEESASLATAINGVPNHDATSPADDQQPEKPTPPSEPLPSDAAEPSTKATTTATTPPPPTTSKPGSSAKPKSTKAAAASKRSPSPSPPPAPPPPPVQTIRLEIRLGGPSNYEVDIASKAKETGQRPPTPTPVVVKVHDSSEEEEDEAAKAQETKKKKKKRKLHTAEYYDTNDPFIDDSELALDERQYFAQTKQQGFYVSSGEVALLKDKTPKKPKSKKLTLSSGLHLSSVNVRTATATAAAQASLSAPPGTARKGSATAATLPATVAAGRAGAEGASRDTPITVDGAADATRSVNVGSMIGPGSTGLPTNGLTTHVKPEDGASTPLGDANGAVTGQKRKRHNSIVVEGGKRKKVVDESLFHPQLQEAIKELKVLIAKESWENKGKFPPHLKPYLSQLAILAIQLDEYDDDFFSLMPALFPYNKFTMTKLIKRTVFPDHLALLNQRQRDLLDELTQIATDGFTQAEAEWTKSVVAWDKRQEKLRAEASGGGSGGGGDGTGTGSAAPTRHPTEEMDVDGAPPSSQQPAATTTTANTTKEPAAAVKPGDHPPAKRYRLTDRMKEVVWELVLLSNECCRLENERNTLENSSVIVSDQGARKILYQKIVAAFPEGWMSSGQISRDVSAMKKRLEKEAMEQEDD